MSTTMSLSLSSLSCYLPHSPHRSPFHLQPFITNKTKQTNPTPDLDFLHKSYTPIPTKPLEKTQLSSIIENEVILGSFKRNSTFGSDFIENVRTLVSQSKKGSKFLEYFDKHGGFLLLKDFNNLFMKLLEADELDISEKLFHESVVYGVIPDSRTLSTMVRCYSQKNKPEEAKQLLDQMLANGFTPSVVDFSIVINSFCVRGKVKKAFEVFEVMGRIGCEPNVQTYNCLMKGLCYVGKVEEAFELLRKIKKTSKKLDVYSYTAVMDGFCKVGRTDEGMELLEEALADGLNPSVVTFNTLFEGYCREGRPLEGMKLLKRMKERDCHPDCITYNTLLHGLLKWSKVFIALKVYKEMVELGFDIDERIANTLLRGICRRSWTNEELLEDVFEVFERIKTAGFTPYPETHCLVIQTLSNKGESEKALAALHEMIRNGHPPTLVTFNFVIRALCSEGRVDDATVVLVLISDVGEIPSGISYNLVINECNKRGRVEDACKLYASAVKRGIRPNRPPKKMLEAGSLSKCAVEKNVLANVRSLTDTVSEQNSAINLEVNIRDYGLL